MVLETREFYPPAFRDDILEMKGTETCLRSQSKEDIAEACSPGVLMGGRELSASSGTLDEEALGPPFMLHPGPIAKDLRKPLGVPWW